MFSHCPALYVYCVLCPFLFFFASSSRYLLYGLRALQYTRCGSSVVGICAGSSVCSVYSRYSAIRDVQQLYLSCTCTHLSWKYQVCIYTHAIHTRTHTCTASCHVSFCVTAATCNASIPPGGSPRATLEIFCIGLQLKWCKGITNTGRRLLPLPHHLFSQSKGAAQVFHTHLGRC